MSVYYPPVEAHENVITAALRVIQGTHYARPEDPHADAEAQYGQEQLALAARALAEAVDKLPEDRQPIGWTKGREVEPEAIHRHFGLSYANYLVLPRTLLQSMPDVWQARFVALLDEMGEAFEHVPQAEAYDVAAGRQELLSDMADFDRYMAGISVSSAEDPERGDVYTRTKTGEELDGDSYVFVPGADPVPHYNRGRTRVEPRLGGGE